MVGAGGAAGLTLVSSGQLSPRAGAREKGQHLADGDLLAGGLGQREVRLDLVAVAAAVFLLDHVVGLGQVGDDAVGAALGDAHAGRDVAQPHARVMCDAQQDPAVIGQEAPARHASKTTTHSRNLLLVFNCGCRLRGDTGTSRRRRPTCPGVTGGAAHDTRGASHYPAEAVTAGRGSAGPGTLARGCRPEAATRPTP